MVATLRFKVLDEDSWRSTMYAGKAMIVGFSEEKSVWVTTRHGGMIRGTKVFIQIGKLTVAGDCIYDDEKSDLALVAGTTVESIGAERPMVSNEITIGRLVGTFGYPSYLDPQLGSGLTWAYIASTSAGPKNGLPAESSGWKTHRFFLLDKSMDACMSGGPVVNTNGFVVGMLVASRCVNNGQTSWVLSASYISDALDNVVVEWIPPPVRDITKSLLPKAELKG